MRLRMMVDHLMCPDGRLDESLLERGDARTFAARWNYQAALGSFLQFVQKRTLPLVALVPWLRIPTIALSREFSITMVHSFLLGGCWPSFSRFGSRKLPRFHRCLKKRMATAHAGAYPSSAACTCLGRHCITTHPFQSASHGSFHSHLFGDLHASVRASGIECPTAGAISPLLVVRDRSFRNWSVHQDRGLRVVGPHGTALASWVNKLLPRLKAVDPEERIWNFDQPAAAKMFNTATGSLGLSGRTMYQTRPSGASIDRVRGFRTLQEGQQRG